MKHELDFEKPISELQRKLEELRAHQDTHAIGIDVDSEVEQIEKKIAETRRQIYLNLTPWQRVQLARLLPARKVPHELQDHDERPRRRLAEREVKTVGIDAGHAPRPVASAE